MKKKMLIATMACVMLFVGCSSNDAKDSNDASTTTEVTSDEQTDDASDIVEEQVDTTNDVDTEATSSNVDLKDYSDQLIEEYGGKLEDNLASALNTSVEVVDDEFSTDVTLCSGAIEIIGSDNGTGFFIEQTKKIDGFSIYGVSIGMSKDDAVKALEEQGLKEDSGDTTYYAIDADDFYITFETEGDTVSEIKFTKCYDAGE